ncbi:hypothetical protein N0V93_007979 [Gnomoniopsis smithogilvyi]|uniref:Uncharacterized protein n=1 Tax=Gnomoniopsis smithogilvyi TaxID=1191159 RepID=A0A9W8YM35_9PEZI|nr:hypothetical protein N0V93_007979 [Gnomoniopsis smithogilvyi]
MHIPLVSILLPLTAIQVYADILDFPATQSKDDTNLRVTRPPANDECADQCLQSGKKQDSKSFKYGPRSTTVAEESPAPAKTKTKTKTKTRTKTKTKSWKGPGPSPPAEDDCWGQCLVHCKKSGSEGVEYCYHYCEEHPRMHLCRDPESPNKTIVAAEREVYVPGRGSMSFSEAWASIVAEEAGAATAAHATASPTWSIS